MNRNRILLCAALSFFALVAIRPGKTAPARNRHFSNTEVFDDQKTIIYVTEVKIGSERARYEDVAPAALAP